jgi:hypothetical protein
MGQSPSADEPGVMGAGEFLVTRWLGADAATMPLRTEPGARASTRERSWRAQPFMRFRGDVDGGHWSESVCGEWSGDR